MLVAAFGSRQVYTPAWSPDGRTIAYSGWTEGGFRDLYLYHLPSGTTRRLTHDRAMDLDPRFSPDGRTLYFSSDRSGIYNIHALGLDDGSLPQVTDVIVGAWQPAISPDGRTMAFVGLSADGFDLYAMDLEASRFRDPAPGKPDRPPAPVIREDVRYPARPYEPIRDLYPRRLEIEWAAFRSQPWFVQVGAAAFDPVGHHVLSADARVVPDADSTALVGGYAYRRFWPTLGATLARDTSRPSGLVLDGVNQRYRLERTRASLQALLPVLRRAEHAVNVGLSYTRQWLKNADEDRYEPDPNDSVPVFPSTDPRAAAAVSVSYRGARAYARSISAEEGRNLVLRFSVDDEALGGTGHARTVTYGWDEFVKNPWADGHVLALRLGGGFSRGDPDRRARFPVGGFGEQDYVQSLLELSFVSGARLRGYPPGVAAGDQFVLLNAEYRLPLADVVRGVSTLPVYLENLHLAAFADWGNAFVGPIEPQEFKLGAGGELRNDVVIGYVVPVVVRLGYAHGFDDGGVDDLYVLLGSGF
jgi:hypothetical protein